MFGDMGAVTTRRRDIQLLEWSKYPKDHELTPLLRRRPSGHYIIE